MYNFFFTSFGKAYVAHLEAPEKKSRIDILCVNSTSRSILMEWDSQAYLATIDSVNHDKNVVLEEAKGKDGRIVLAFKDYRGGSLPSCKNELEGSVEVVTKKKSMSLSFKAPNSEKVCLLDVVVKYGEYEATICFHGVPEKDLYNVVLDFGSEASQMLVCKHNSDSAIVPEKVFANTLAHFYKVKGVKAARVYDQQDDDDKLFRSVFYLKKNAVMSDSFVYDRPSKDDTFFSFMSKRTENHEGRIPNIKIAYLTGAIVDGVSDMQTLHRGIVSRFLHEAVYRISELHKGSDSGVGINFTVLLPNVMPQSAVSSFLKEMRRVANSPEFHEANGSGLPIEYVNVSSCSESDASFLECLYQAALPGTKEKMKVRPGKRYLIIDIGKGTTDFSIVRLLSAKSAISEYRAGFVGAGNAISYAVFSDYMGTIAGEKSVDLQKKMLDSEPALLFELENKIEDAKKDWENGKSAKDVAPVSRIDGMTAEAVLERIDDMGVIDDSKGEVAKMLEVISDRIVDQIPMDDVDYVVFSGRSFKFKKLREQLELRLQRKLGKNIEVFFNPETAKNGCLFGPLRNIRLSLESQMVGFPIVIDVTKVRQAEAKVESTDATSVIPAINAETFKLDKVEGFVQRVSQGVKSVMEFLGYEDQAESSGTLKKMSVNFDSEIKSYMTVGKEIRSLDQNSCVIISGNVYTTDQYLVNNNDTPYSIYFDGDDFYLKHSTGCHKLVMQVNRGSQNLLAESQFPYSLAFND